MVKPVGSLCNLDCTYCYYLHKQTLLRQPKQPQMADAMLEQHIRQYIEAQTGDEVVFSWQGGEPTILGVAFFRKVVLFQARHRKPGQRIENDLQTNGTLLDEEWATFLKEQRFLVGLSCDGPQALHDRHRVTRGGAPTHAKVVAAARLLRQHDIPFAVLCVVNRHNAKHPLDVYRFLSRELGTWRVQFIPGVEPKSFHDVAPQHWDPATLPIVGTPGARPGTPESVVTDWSVDPDDWERSCARSGTTGTRTTTGACTWTCSRPRWRSRSACRRSAASRPSSAEAPSPSSTTATSSRATTTCIPSTGSATSRRRISARSRTPRRNARSDWRSATRCRRTAGVVRISGFAGVSARRRASFAREPASRD